jgi:tRNA pseudouridine32 synthase/23S rRNA pseudouridine746 synthase
MPAAPVVEPGLRLIHADAALLVFDKPAGLLAVPGRGADKQDCLSTRAQHVWPEALVVHRLDMGTSGLIVLARSPTAQRRLSMAFAARQVHKRYIALVHGLLPAPMAAAADAVQSWGTIDLPLLLDWPNRPLSKVDPIHGKPSLTRWRVLQQTQLPGSDTACTRVELEPVTGRSHQLRVHLLALGHPIVGDALYAPPTVQALAPRLLLHAQVLELAHPDSGAWLRFESPAPF